MATWNDNSTEPDMEYYSQALNADNQPIADNWSFPPSNYDYYDDNNACGVTNLDRSYANPAQNEQNSYVGFQQFVAQFKGSSLESNEAKGTGQGFSGLTVYNTSIPVSSTLTPTATEFVPRSVANYNKQYITKPTTGDSLVNDRSNSFSNDEHCSVESTSSNSRDWWRQYKPSQDQNEHHEKRNKSENKENNKSVKENNELQPESSKKYDKGNYRNYEPRDRHKNNGRYSDRNIDSLDTGSSRYDRNGSSRRRERDSRYMQEDDQKRSNVRSSNPYEGGKNRYERRFNEDTRYNNYDSEGSSRSSKSGRDYFKRDKGNRYEGNNQNRNYKDNEIHYEYTGRSNRETKCLERDKRNVGVYNMKRPHRNFSNDETVKIEQDSQGSQRERLTSALDRGTLECLVCCEQVKPHQHVWSCLGCYHVLHLTCIIKWASTSKADNGWRCPACQRLCTQVPTTYQCFCQKVDNPRYNRHDSAHSCGRTCGRPGVEPCVHNCTLLCHPGPCPPCQAQVSRKCGCGRTSRIVQCSQLEMLLCDAICDKDLNCGQHKCEKNCHEGLCPNCEIKIKQECYCGKQSKEVICDAENALVKKYTCEAICEGTLNCGNHKCQLICHDGDCQPCMLDPEKVSTCPCGKKTLPENSRSSCLDAVPVCGEICDKPLKCGPPSRPHTCSHLCHKGPCPVCPLETLVRCRCGHMDREMQCSLLTTRADDARCQKKCTKKRECGRHKCNAPCCIAIEHPCPLPCSHMLSCGLHRCESNCHRGRCQPCWRSSFEELSCECGASIRHPPVPCGARRPPCDRPCSRQHPCAHPVMHTCHSDPDCPPCTVLCSKWCHGKHEMRKTIPCHQADFSCGKPCGRALPCGRHTCQLPCHKGVCLRDGQTCTQPCLTARSTCGHTCKAPCHDGTCPDTPCKEMVKVTCQCKHRSTTRACADTTRDYQRIATAMLASKMADMQRGETVNIQDILSNRGGANLKTLECTEECRVVERNRRMTIGLQIRNPDLSNKLSPRYSDFLKQWAKRDPSFVQNIHDKLTELVRLAKQSKQKFRSYSFPVMNREKRQVVHEMCEQFGIEGEAYDAEPNRNVVATADKEKSWLPSMSVMEVVQRESGQRKVPVPSMGMRAPRNN